MAWLVDTSVWIAFLRGHATKSVKRLRGILASADTVGVAPVVIMEVRLIAQIAIEHGLTLLHDDDDFRHLARVVPDLQQVRR
jgi:predicted nucleic acid-binding protein